MMKILLAGLAFALASVGAAQAQAPGALRAGAAKVDITPPTSALPVGGSIRDALYVRAIVVSNGQTCAALVGIDQGGVATEAVRNAITAASQATRCPAENFIISATHTHSGGTGGGGLGGEPNAARVTQAIISAVTTANAALRPVRVGVGETTIDLNVNRDRMTDGIWHQGPNPEAPSDKRLSVVSFIGEDGVPVGAYVNYAMHPINFYLSGVVSADYAGEASRYIEHRYGDRTVAVFSQGASGDQNPRLGAIGMALIGQRTGVLGYAEQRVGQPTGWVFDSTLTNGNQLLNDALKDPVPAGRQAAFNAAVADADRYVSALGTLVGEAAIDVMRSYTPTRITSGAIRGVQASISCPGRDRLDATARQGTLPPYKDGADVNIEVGALKIGDINLVRVNGEVYSEIGMRVKASVPAAKTVFVTLANGRANSGYIYSNNASGHLSFQVIGSRLKPGCAEDKIVDAAIRLTEQLNR